MSEEQCDDLKTNMELWMKRLMLKNGISKYEMKIDGTSEKGDNYMSDVTFLTIETTRHGKPETGKLVVKSSKQNQQVRELIPVQKAFENEIYIYDTILPLFKRFQRTKSIEKPFDNVPKLFSTMTMPTTELIALRDLRTENFKLWDRKKPMPLDHVEEIMRVYGRLHAVSYALRDQKLDMFLPIANHLYDMMKEFAKNMNPEEFRVYDNMKSIAKELGDSICLKSIEALEERTKIMHDLTDPNDPYAVILHGDCWNNNFMFKYEDETEKKLEKVCLLDWQLSRLASPVYDLSYFLFTCVSDTEIQHFDHLNQIYYDSLSKALKELGSDPEKMFPYAELEAQWKRFGAFGLMMMASVLRLSLSDKDECPDMMESAEKGRDACMESFNYEVKNQDDYGKRTLAAVRLASEKGFLDPL